MGHKTAGSQLSWGRLGRLVQFGELHQDGLGYSTRKCRKFQKEEEEEEEKEERELVEEEEEEEEEDRVVQIFPKKQHCNMRVTTTWMQCCFS